MVIGDVHGHIETASKMIDELNLEEGDCVVSLGDLIDRGPSSAETIRMFRNEQNLLFLLGNHEFMMLRALETDRNKSWNSWLKYGGKETLKSFETERGSHDEMSLEWVDYLNSIPTEIVLDDFRLVHAGFDPTREFADQRDHERLWSRSIFHCEKPIDPKRQIIVGHTPVQEIDEKKNGEPWFSNLKLEDGRSAIIGMDTGICLEEEMSPCLSAINLQNGDVLSVRRQ